MYCQIYEISAIYTSSIIVATSLYIIIINQINMAIFLLLSGFFSCITRLYRIRWKEYIMDHPIVYLDIFFAILAFITYIYDPYLPEIYYPIVFAFGLMIIAAIMSWPIFNISLVRQSFILQLLGHIIISGSLLYYVINDLTIIL
jgi:hypothetical protein